MDTHRSITISKRIYARLLALYPAGYRAEYGADMLQLFTDQCRAAAGEKKALAFLSLWLRTLADLGISALCEHMTAPHTWQGLLEAIPNAPLPWGGVALVLLPGLIFFFAQVGQLTGEDWFFLLTYRAGYFMIVPVLIVWAWKRKFPIWGLMPLGLLFRTGMGVALRLQTQYLQIFSSTNVWWFDLLERNAAEKLRAVTCVLMIASILGLLWLANRRARFSAKAWGGLGLYVLLIAFLSSRNVIVYLAGLQAMPEEQLAMEIRLGITNIGWGGFNSVYNILYDYLGLLILILLGALLARRHGRLAILLALGYLLPTLIYGRVRDSWPGVGDPDFLLMVSVSVTALIYRFLVALAGPLWIVRSASGEQQKRAGAISMLALVGIQAAFSLTLLFTNPYGSDLIYIVWDLIARQLILAAAVFLALNLYHATPSIDLVPLRQSEEAVPQSGG